MVLEMITDVYMVLSETLPKIECKDGLRTYCLARLKCWSKNCTLFKRIEKKDKGRSMFKEAQYKSTNSIILDSTMFAVSSTAIQQKHTWCVEEWLCDSVERRMDRVRGNKVRKGRETVWDYIGQYFSSMLSLALILQMFYWQDKEIAWVYVTKHTLDFQLTLVKWGMRLSQWK